MRKNTMSYRIWSGIDVRCTKHEEGCSWTGSIADFPNHLSSCIHGMMTHSRILEVEELKQKIRDLENENKALNMIISQMPDVATRLMDEALRGRELVPKIFYGDYNFRRENVVQLSQLISRNLENKPLDIDSNRIYQCVSNCYRDLTQNYADNPEFYEVDMQMLLATCNASTWFTVRQRLNIEKWLREYNW